MRLVSDRVTPDPMLDEPEPTVTKVSVTECEWALVDKNGTQYPHDIRAYWRVSGAGELLDGDYCARHAAMAVRRWREREEES